jgi:hypothetical protein
MRVFGIVAGQSTGYGVVETSDAGQHPASFAKQWGDTAPRLIYG